MFVSCKKQLTWYNCASLVPLGMKWAYICAEKWVLCLVVLVMCLCLVVVGCVWLCEHALLCFVVLLVAVDALACCVVMTVQKRTKRRL